MFLVLATTALALDPPLKNAFGGGACVKIPCNGVTADPSAGIVPADVVEAIGQGTRTDLAWTEVDVVLGDGAFAGWLIAETDGRGNLDTTGGLWFYGAALLDSDTTEDLVAGELVYTPGEAMSARFDVMFDAGSAAWAPTHTLSLSAEYAGAGSSAAPVHQWTLGSLDLLDARGSAVYHVETQPLDVEVTAYGLAYHQTQNTRNPYAVSVEEALTVFADGAALVAWQVGSIGRASSTVSSAWTVSDAVDVESGNESATGSTRDFRASASTFAVTGGALSQETVSTRGGTAWSRSTTTQVDGASGISTRTASGAGVALALTPSPTAGASTNVFTSMMRTLGDQ